MCLPDGDEAVFSCLALKKHLKSSIESDKEISWDTIVFRDLIHSTAVGWKVEVSTSESRNFPDKKSSNRACEQFGLMELESMAMFIKGVDKDCKE